MLYKSFPSPLIHQKKINLTRIYSVNGLLCNINEYIQILRKNMKLNLINLNNNKNNLKISITCLNI